MKESPRSVGVGDDAYESDSTSTERTAVTKICLFQDMYLSKATEKQRPLTHSALITGL